MKTCMTCGMEAAAGCDTVVTFPNGMRAALHSCGACLGAAMNDLEAEVARGAAEWLLAKKPPTPQVKPDWAYGVALGAGVVARKGSAS